MRRNSVLLAVMLLGLIVSRADAMLLVDTGVSSETGYRPDRGIATQFTLAEDSFVQSIQFWLDKYEDPSFGPLYKDVTWPMYLYTETKNDPYGIGPSGDAILLGDFTLSGATQDWHGLDALNLSLPKGTYWASLGGETGSLDPSSPILIGKALNPSGPSAQFDGWWFRYPEGGLNQNKQYALQVGGQAVPEPATVFLFGGGLLGAFYRRKRK